MTSKEREIMLAYTKKTKKIEDQLPNFITRDQLTEALKGVAKSGDVSVFNGKSRAVPLDGQYKNATEGYDVDFDFTFFETLTPEEMGRRTIVLNNLICPILDRYGVRLGHIKIGPVDPNIHNPAFDKPSDPPATMV